MISQNVRNKILYKIRKMDIKDYSEIIGLWKNTAGVGLSGNDDSKKSIKIFLEKIPNICSKGFVGKMPLKYFDVLL